MTTAVRRELRPRSTRVPASPECVCLYAVIAVPFAPSGVEGRAEGLGLPDAAPPPELISLLQLCEKRETGMLPAPSGSERDTANGARCFFPECGSLRPPCHGERRADGGRGRVRGCKT